ncbi:MAG TPA: ABC transporter permease [Petrotogaceae bacterium]|nr:ABC transporter permease [Petrotogaceae bacterium]
MNKEELKRTLKKFFKNSSAMLGLILLIFFVIIAILAPVLAPARVPEDLDLDIAKNLMTEYSAEKRPEIINAYDSFITTLFIFYTASKEDIQSLEPLIKNYEKDHSKIVALRDKVKVLCDEYILDSSYYNRLTLTELEKLVLMYENKEVSKEEFLKVLEKDYVKNFAIDASVLAKIDKDEKATLRFIRSQIKTNISKAVNELKNEIKVFEKKNKEAIEVRLILDRLSNTSEENFLKESQAAYKKFRNMYIKSINFDPYLMPNVVSATEPQKPSKEFIFGISNNKDIFYGVVWGTRTGFKIGLIVVAISTVIGLFIGSIAAYFGGWLDEVLMRVTDMFMSIPFTLSAMVLTTILGTGLSKVMIAMIVFGWMATARLIRGSILQAKTEQYVLAAKALGVPDWKIIIAHILPNTIFPVLVQASMRIGSMVITASALSFLGVGAPAGYADWGSILTYARDWMLGGGRGAMQYWYTIVFPGTAMVLFVLAWNLVGDALRDIFDPKLRM